MPMESELIRRIPPMDSVTLGNGVSFRWHHADEGEEVCSLNVIFNGGAVEIGTVQQQLLFSQLFEGTVRLDADTIAERLDDTGVVFRPRADAHFTGFSLLMLRRTVPALMDLMGTVMTDAVFPEDRLEIGRKTALAALEASKDDVNRIAARKFMSLLAGRRHPLAQEVLPQHIQSVTSAGLRELHRRMFTGTNCTAFLGGCLDGDTVYHVRRALSALPEGRFSEDKIKIVTHPYQPELAGVKVYPHRHNEQCAIVGGVSTIGRDHPDYIALRFAVTALGGYFGSRLMQELRERRGLTYSIAAFLCGGRDGSHVQIQANTAPPQRVELIDGIRAEIKRLATEPPCGEELKSIQMYLVAGALQSLDNPMAVTDFHVTRHIVGIPEDYFAEQLRQAMEMTPERVAQVAKKYLHHTALRIAVVGK